MIEAPVEQAAGLHGSQTRQDHNQNTKNLLTQQERRAKKEDLHERLPADYAVLRERLEPGHQREDHLHEEADHHAEESDLNHLRRIRKCKQQQTPRNHPDYRDRE